MTDKQMKHAESITRAMDQMTDDQLTVYALKYCARMIRVGAREGWRVATSRLPLADRCELIANRKASA